MTRDRLTVELSRLVPGAEVTHGETTATQGADGLTLTVPDDTGEEVIIEEGLTATQAAALILMIERG